MRLQDMTQNSFFPDAIEREATKAQANAHHHNCLSSKDIALKNYSDLLNNFLQIISSHF